MTPSRRWGVVGLVAMHLSQVIGCAPRIRERPPHALPVAVEPAGSEVEVYEWNGSLVTGPVVSPTTIRIPRAPKPRSYVVRASMPGHSPQYWITSVEGHRTTGGGAPWLLFGPPVSGEAAIILGAVVVLLLVLAMLTDDREEEWEMAPEGVSASLAEVVICDE